MVGKVVDIDANSYYTMNYGAEAGIWMTENLRVLHYADGTPLPPNSGTGIDDYTDRRWVYPSLKNNLIDPSYLQKVPKAGILYNWMAATNKANIATPTSTKDQLQINSPIPGDMEVESIFETTPGAKDGKLRGICPSGWHLPSDREWNVLEKEIYNNVSKYSTYTQQESVFSPTAWDPIWEWGRPLVEANQSWGPRGSVEAQPGISSPTNIGHGPAMISPCSPVEGRLSHNKSLPVDKGGFSLLLMGAVEDGAFFDQGEKASLWTSSDNYYESTPRKSATKRDFTNGRSKVSRNMSTTDEFRSIRCKKD